MNTIRRLLRNSFIAALIMLLVGAMPVPVYAQDSGSNPGTDTAITQEQTVAPMNGASAPTGAASWTYWRNEATGLWENDYYTYNPSSNETVPKTPLEYTYDPTTGMWKTEVWQYVASESSYSKRPVYVSAPPAGAITHGGPEAVVPDQPQTAADTTPSTVGNQETVAAGGQTDQPSPPVIQHQLTDGQNGQTGTPYTGQVGGNLNFANSGTITNYLDSTARSGNAIVIANTTAGSATSGDASATANIINLLQSQSALGAAGMATFTANIQGNVQGDFLIDPTHFVQPAGGTAQPLTNLQVNTQNEGTIANNINLDASSGNANAAQNTTVGNVSSGDANAIANVVNMINSVVAANQSFMGVINIHGDYTGNILMPTDSLNALLASAGPNGTAAVATDINNTSTQNINNNIDLAAVSGNATGSQNTTSGNVTSGNGLTNLTLLNLTGRQVVAANSLLVFVNVLGNWVGLIMDAPAGTTSAALGGGVASNAQTALATRTDISNTEKFGIDNNITAHANSGNANATQNTTVGDVRTGNATASANVANIIGSQFSLSNWFGVLFINVFGTWRGNFGVAKPPVIAPITSGASGTVSGAVPRIGTMRVFTFTPKDDAASNDLQLSPLSESGTVGSLSSKDIVDSVSKVLSSSTATRLAKVPTQTKVSDAAAFDWSGLVLAMGLAGFGFVGVDRVRANLRNRRTISRR